MRYLTVVLIALAFVSAASTAVRLPAPCSLVTNAQVAKGLGYKIQTRSALASRLAGRGPNLPTCTWSAPPIGYSQSQPNLRVQAIVVSKARFTKIGAENHLALTPGFGAPTYVLFNGSYIQTWKNRIELTFMFQQAATTPKATITLVKEALTQL